MRISAQEEYGLRCLLCLARVGDGSSLTIPEISAAEGISHPYVAKLLAVLRQAGLIESVRGRSGGYRLAKSPAEVNLGTVLLVLGEPLFEVDYCQKHAGSGNEGACVHHYGCTLRALWHTLEQWMRRTLNQLTLADLMQSEGEVSQMLRAKLAETITEPGPNLIALSLARAAE